MLLIAELFARRGDSDSAERCWQFYHAIPSKLMPTLSLAAIKEPRYALEQYTFGLMKLAFGLPHEARKPLQEAFETWSHIGYRCRSVLAATALAKVTGDRKLLDYAVQETDAHFPRAWFSSSLDHHRIRMHPDLRNLSKTRQEIALGILAGKTYEEIAKSIGISRGVVRNRFDKMLDTFDVTPRNRGQFAHLMRSRGVGSLDSRKGDTAVIW